MNNDELISGEVQPVSSTTTNIYTQNFPDSSGLVLNVNKVVGVDSETGSNYLVLDYEIANPTGSTIIVNDIYYVVDTSFPNGYNDTYTVANRIELTAGSSYTLTSFYALETEEYYQNVSFMVDNIENNLATISIYPNDISNSRQVTGTVPALANNYDSFVVKIRLFEPYIDGVDFKSSLSIIDIPELTLNGVPIDPSTSVLVDPTCRFVMTDSSDNRLRLGIIEYVYSNQIWYNKCEARTPEEVSVLANWNTNTISLEEYVPGGTVISDELLGESINLDAKFSLGLHYVISTPWESEESYGNMETLCWVLDSLDSNSYRVSDPIYEVTADPNNKEVNLLGLSFLHTDYEVSTWKYAAFSVYQNDPYDEGHTSLNLLRTFVNNLKTDGFTINANLYYDSEARVETLNTPNVTGQITSTFNFWRAKGEDYPQSLIVLNSDSVNYWENLDPIATLYMYNSTRTIKSPIFIKYGTVSSEVRLEYVDSAEVLADWQTNPIGFEDGQPTPPGPTPPGPTPSGNLAEYLEALVRDRNTLVTNLTTMGVQASTAETFTELVPKVLEIPQPSGTLNITSNDTYDVTDYAEAVVNVPGGITPTGSITLSQNDTYDVTQYAEAVVNVPGPSGTISITQNGNAIDVSQYQYANVSVSGGSSDYNAYMIMSTNELDYLSAEDGDYAMLPSDYSMPLDAKVFGSNKYTAIYDMTFAPNLVADLTQYNSQISLTDLFAEIGQSWASIMQIQYSPGWGGDYTLTFTINSSTTISYTSQDGINWTTSDAVPVQFPNGVVASGNDWSGANAQFLADLFNNSTSIYVMQHSSLVWEARDDSGSVIWELIM